MKKILFTILLVILYQFISAQENILFKGHITNPEGNIISLYDIWGRSFNVQVDSLGNFSFSFEYSSEDFFNLSYNEQLFLVYLSTDGILNIKFDYKDIDSSIEYMGKGADFNKALYKLSRGKPAPDFTLSSIEGKEISLSDFKGQYVYINIWASYCGGCMKEIPYFEKLKEEFQGRNIVFLSISGDSKKKRWHKVITKKDLTGIQLINEGFKSDFSHKYLNYGSPRYILIDKEQRIINANANKPSDISKILDELKEL